MQITAKDLELWDKLHNIYEKFSTIFIPRAMLVEPKTVSLFPACG